MNKQVFEVQLPNRIMWIAADSEEAIRLFFPEVVSVKERPDCDPAKALHFL